MNINYTNYKTLEYEIMQDSHDEIYFRSKQPYSSKNPFSITLNDQYKEKIYIRLANANDVSRACSFCNEYGTLFPTNSILITEFQALENSINVSPKIPLSYDYIPYRHFKFYQLTMFYLVSIYQIITQKEIPQKDLSTLFSHCIDLILNPHLIDFFQIEFLNIFDEDEMSSSLSDYPLIEYIFHIHTRPSDKYSSIEYFNADISHLENNINIFPNENLRDFFKCTLNCYSNNTFKTTLKYTKNLSNNIISLAKYIFSQTLEFFIRDTTPVVTFNDFDNISSWKFTSLANAIFFYFYIDTSNKYSYKVCENLYCNDLFTCPSERKNRKYCSARCAHNVTNRKYKNKNKNK